MGPDGEGESDDDPGGANQADLGYQGECVAMSGKNTFTFPFFLKICFILFPFFSGWRQLSKTKPREKKKKKTARDLLRAVSAEAPATLIVLIRCQFLLH